MEKKLKYQTVVIDFSWEVKNNLKDTTYYRCGDQRMPYKPMTDEEILNFPIEDFADERCDLFLWSITSKIPFCFNLLDKWGFKYMDFIAWDKVVGVPVNGIYRKAEWLIYGYRGKMGINKSGSFIPTIIREKRGKHSEKPNLLYDILKTNTTAPRIDIFARKRHEGFDAFGDEIEKQIQLKIS